MIPSIASFLQDRCDDFVESTDDILLEAVALLIPNKVQSNPPVLSPTLSSVSTAFAAIATIPDDESTTRNSQRSEQSRRRRRHHHGTEAASPPEWIGSSQHSLRGIDLQFNTGLIYALDFSPDGSFLVSGGADKRLRLWNIREILGGYADSRPIQMESEHGDGGVLSVCVSPNNRSIFSGGTKDKTVLIHDIET